MRYFTIVSKYLDKGINIPKRSTKASAGYDIESAKDVTISPGCTELIPTGLKVCMNDDEFLSIHVRSSVGIKRGLVLANCTGIIDSDYFNNPDNEGHILIALKNTTHGKVSIKKGERIAQGVFQKYLVMECDKECGGARTGGIGSTGRYYNQGGTVKLEKGRWEQ